MGKTKPGQNRDEIQKLKSRVAAKNRRKNEHEQFEELVLLNPWINSNTPDKSTTIRLTTSYIGLMKVLNSSSNAKQIEDGSGTSSGDASSSGQEIEKLGLEALDGFIIILSNEGRIIFVNEKSLTYLGLTQNELLGRSIYNFVLKKDWEIVARKLKGPLPSHDNPNIKYPEVDDGDEICEISGAELFIPYFEKASGSSPSGNKKVQFSVRVQCNMVRRNNSYSSNFKVLRFTGNIGKTGDFSGLVQPAWSPDVGDLPVHQSVFISRLTPNLKLLFCEGRIHRYMDTEAKDIVGRVVYPFYHPEDIFYIQKLHSKLLAKGQCITEPYRWMNKDGGWVWMESKVRQIKCEKTGQLYMLCVNHVLSAVESKGVVLGLNPPTEENVVETDRKEHEYDSNDAHIFDPKIEALTQNVSGWTITDKEDMPSPCQPQHQPEPKYEVPEPKYEVPKPKYEVPELKYEVLEPKCEVLPETTILQSIEPPECFEPCDEDEFVLPEFVMSPDGVQKPSLDIDNALNEGTAFFAAEFFMGNTVDRLFPIQNASASSVNSSASLNSSGTTIHGQDNFTSTIINLQSLMENESFTDLSVCSVDHSDIANTITTTPFPSFVSQPHIMDISNKVSDMQCQEVEDIDLYTLDFDTQFLH